MMTQIDWDSLIGEAYRQGNEARARSIIESMAYHRDSRPTDAETIAAARATLPRAGLQGKFRVGERVVAAWDGRTAVVVDVRDERFSVGGVQQVLCVRWSNGTRDTMRAAHLTPAERIDRAAEGEHQ